MSKLQELKNKHAAELKILDTEEEVTASLEMGLRIFAKTNHNKRTTIFIDLEKTKVADITPALEKIVSVFPPTNDTREIQHKGKVTHCSPFLLCTESNIHGGKVILTYSGKYDFRITLPLIFYSDDILGYYNREVSDTEHHYFGGTAMSAIAKMKIEKRQFDLFKTLQYYGGNTACVRWTKTDAEEYKFMALNGHIRQHGDFWKQQKIEMGD